MISMLYSLCFLSFFSSGPTLDLAVSSDIQAALAAPRPDADRARDPLRKPGDVLTFFGLEPGMRVIDFSAGSGYYTHILAKLVGESGKVYAQNTPFVLKRFVKDGMQKRVAEYDLKNVELITSEFDNPLLPGQVDAVVMILFYHDTYWQKTDRKAMNKAIYDALKPGAVFGLVDHSAKPGSKDRDVQTLHRVDAEMVKQELMAAGFIFDGQSHVLAHPEDTRDWPFFKDPAKTRDRTDRFIFRFRKPR